MKVYKMANMIVNKLYMNGPASSVLKLLSLFDTDEDKNDTFEMDVSNHPETGSPIYGHDVVIKFGVDATAQFNSEIDRAFDQDRNTLLDVFIRFETKWTPAYYWVGEVAKQFPAMSIDYRFGGCCGEPAGDVVFRDGAIKLEDFGVELFKLTQTWLDNRLEDLHDSAAQSLENQKRVWKEVEERIEEIKIFDRDSKHLARYRFEGTGMQHWLNQNLPLAFRLEDEALWDRGDDYLYIALDKDERPIFEAFFEDEISVIR
jgi:hypothetical protein